MIQRTFLRLVCGLVIILCHFGAAQASSTGGSTSGGSTGINPLVILHAAAKPAMVIFTKFEEISVRHLLSKLDTTTDSGGADWKSGDTVEVFEDGHAGQNPELLWYSGTTWLPHNVDPMHKEDSAYKFTRPGATSDLVLSWQVGVADMSETRNSTLRAGIGYIRKSMDISAESDNGFSEMHTPMGIRLTGIIDDPSASVQIMYDTTSADTV